MLLATLLLGGCDPEGPGAEGSISLGEGVDTSAFATLKLRAYPNDDAMFDSSKIVALSAWTLDVPLTDVTFPYPYQVGEVATTTPNQHWRMAAWLSRNDSERPETGEPSCSVPFEIADCGGGFDGYCTVSANVSCTIE